MQFRVIGMGIAFKKPCQMIESGKFVTQEGHMKIVAEKDPKKYILLIVLVSVFVYLVM